MSDYNRAKSRTNPFYNHANFGSSATVDAPNRDKQTQWNQPIWQLPALEVASIGNVPVAYRFYKITSIIEAKPHMHRLAMSNVIANMNQADHALVYMIASDQHGIHFYLGVVGANEAVDALGLSGRLLKSAFEGNFLGAQLEEVGAQAIDHLLGQRTRLGLITGTPSLNIHNNHPNDEESQGIERLVNGLAGECWQLIVLAEPTQPEITRQLLGEIIDFSTELSAKHKLTIQSAENKGWQTSSSQGTSSSKTKGTNRSQTFSEANSTNNKGTTDGVNDSITDGCTNSDSTTDSGGTSSATTHDMVNKRIEELQKHVSEIQIPRFRLGQSKGMFRTAIYVCAESKGLYQRLSRSVLSIFQGNKAGMTPLQVHTIEQYQGRKITDLFALYDTTLKKTERQAELVYSIAASPTSPFFQGGTWLTSEELAHFMGLPGKELPGLQIRKSVDFALNPRTGQPLADDIILGNVIQHGKTLAFKSVNLPHDELRKHLFVTGVTGSGKTTTCMKILLASKLPFLVLEPAKT